MEMLLSRALLAPLGGCILWQGCDYVKHVKSGMPQGVIEKPVREGKEDPALGDRVVDCFVTGNFVGRRVYNHEGIMVLETPMKDGLKHGREITWDDEGNLLSIEPYAKGKIHGTANSMGVLATTAYKNGTRHRV
jgi:hypothetical protein